MQAATLINSEQSSLRRQVVHWRQAALRLSNLEHLASGIAWHGIEHDMGIMLRKQLQKSIDDVVSGANSIYKQMEHASEQSELRNIKRQVNALREQYLKAEETINFYTVAINSRTTPNVAALLRACDILCVKSMQELLKPLGKGVPNVLTYIDKGIGASILKAGLRLWDGNISSIAAIKVTQHNLFRPTAIIHETGHQVAHITGWNEELANAFEKNLSKYPEAVRKVFASWSGEIAADAFAFVNCGYASVAALHDVVSGTPFAVFAFHAHDPHPISYVRVIIGIEMCRLFYGSGPWDDLESSFKNDYDINLVNFPSVPLINMCLKAMPDIIPIILKTQYQAFKGQSLSQIIQPDKVSPQALQKLEDTAGPALYTSHGWLWKECIKILALIGYKIGKGQGDLESYYKLQEEWMLRLGFAVELN